MMQGEGVHSLAAPSHHSQGRHRWECGVMSGRREASSVLVLVECEPSWAWLPPASPQGATTKHSALPRLTLCRVRKGDNPLHCVAPT